jgi:hypothetical protein
VYCYERVDVQVSSVPQLHDAKGGGLVLGECCPSSTTKGLDLRFVDDLAYFLKKSTTNGASMFFFWGISLSRTCFSGPDERQR